MEFLGLDLTKLKCRKISPIKDINHTLTLLVYLWRQAKTRAGLSMYFLNLYRVKNSLPSLKVRRKAELESKQCGRNFHNDS